MKKENHTVGTIPKIKYPNRRKRPIPLTHNHMTTHPLFWIGTGTLIKSGGVILIL